MAKYLNQNQIKSQVYLTLHSYGQYFLIPWGYEVAFPSDYNDMLKVAKSAASKFRRYKFTVGNSADLLYPAAGMDTYKEMKGIVNLIILFLIMSGGSDDWAKSIGIKYSYTVELADTGNYGFVLPASFIKPVCEDFFPAMEVFAGAASLKN